MLLGVVVGLLLGSFFGVRIEGLQLFGQDANPEFVKKEGEE